MARGLYNNHVWIHSFLHVIFVLYAEKSVEHKKKGTQLINRERDLFEPHARKRSILHGVTVQVIWNQK